MGLGGLSALSGLAKPIDRVGAEAREFDSMNQYKAELEKDAQDSLAAQELEAKQYAEISEKASQLLEPDRDKIRAKSIELQKMIRSKIEEYGSRKAFFAAGGAALLAKYKNDLLSSKETTSFFDNKKNMESLIKLKEAGKGHLISSIDLQSMNNYLEGKGDKITYSGMKSEIEIPENYFDYGVDIPAQNILHYKDNYMGIYGNWLIENPDKAYLKGPDLEEQLLSYTMRNHSGKGLNEFNRKAEAAARAVREEKEAIAKAGTKEAEPIRDSWVSQMNEVLANAKRSGKITLSSLMNPVNRMKQYAMEDPNFSEVLGTIVPYESAVSNYTSKNFGDSIWYGISRTTGFDNKYKVAGGFVVPGNKSDIASVLYKSKGVSGINLNLNTAEFYSPNGERLTDEYVQDSLKEGTNSNVTFQTLIYANFDANGKLITQKLDRNGKTFRKSQKEKMTSKEKDHMSKFTGEPTTEMVAVLVNSEGETIYHKIPSSSYRDETELAKIIGASNDTTDARKRRININQEAAKKKQETIAVQKNLDLIVAESSAPGKPFGTPEFINQAREARSPGGKNRDALIKAYYMAVSHYKNQRPTLPEDLEKESAFYSTNPDNFMNIVNSSKELKNAMINHSGFTDTSFMDLFTKIHSGDDPDDLNHNREFQQYWLKYYTNLKKQ